MAHARIWLMGLAAAGLATAAQAQSPQAQALKGELRCPASGCPAELVTNPGTTVDPKTGRKFFLDMPSDLKPGEKVTFILNLHGGGSYGNWQRHYFPVVDLVDKHRLVVATPNAPPRRWTADDDAHLRNVVEMVEQKIGKDRIGAFWLAGHSQGGMTSRRIVCQPFFAERVTGFLSLSGGRIGGQAPRAPNAGRPPQRNEPPAAASPAATPAPAASQPPAEPACDFSHIFAIGEHEIASLPETSAWAAKYGCGPRVRRATVTDTQPGYVYDTTRQDPASKAWGRLPGGGKAEVYVYPNCKGGRVVADVVRIDKGHTEGLEPNVTEELVRLMKLAQR